ANANTPGYKAQDVTFAEQMNKSSALIISGLTSIATCARVSSSNVIIQRFNISLFSANSLSDTCNSPISLKQSTNVR
ncbi:hypothetical protein ACT4UM_21830, partial [Bacillus sp. SS-TM]